MRRAALACAVLAATVAATCFAQSLGQVAERQKKASPKPGKVFTEDDLARSRGVANVPGAEPSASPKASGPADELVEKVRGLMGRTLRSSSEREEAERAAAALVGSNALAGRSRPQVEELLGSSSPQRSLAPAHVRWSR